MLINCHTCMHALYYETSLKSSCAIYCGMEGVHDKMIYLRLLRTTVLKCLISCPDEGEMRKCVRESCSCQLATPARPYVDGHGRMRKIQVLVWRNAGGHAHAQWSPIDAREQSTRTCSPQLLRVASIYARDDATRGDRTGPAGRRTGVRKQRGAQSPSSTTIGRRRHEQPLANNYISFFFLQKFTTGYDIYCRIFKNAYSMNDTENIVISFWILHILSYDIWYKRREK